MSAAIGPSDYVLEAVNIYYTGHIEPVTWTKQITGTTQSGLILRDLSFEVHSGEIMAILGSKGSGKKALLDVIGCRAYGPRKGYILLNGVAVNKRLAQSTGSYLNGMGDEYLQPGLTVHQTLYYEACFTLNVPFGVRKLRIKQILSDVALTQAAETNVDNLTVSERRRLSLGVQLMKDPVVLLADEPAWNLDPLNTYFIISILSNYAKKYGRIIILTMEKPRSDIFPFLDRVTYLCLGDVVYSGNTRLMLEYFRTIGFPCPEVENPLMYYLCLATVDRRTHERFIESNNQIGLLVEKFKSDGNPFRKGGGNFSSIEGRASAAPLHALGRPSFFSTVGTLIERTYASTFMLTWRGLKNIIFQLLLLPLLFFILWIFYFGAQNAYQHAYVTQNGLVFNIVSVTYFASIWSTVVTFTLPRDRYYQESRDGHYSGPTFVIGYTLSTVLYSLVVCLIASRLAFECSGLSSNYDWLLLYGVMYAMYSFGIQLTLPIMLIVKDKLVSAAFMFSVAALTVILSSGTVRTMRNLPDWLYYITYVTQPRYSGGFISQQLFDQYSQELPVLREITRSCNKDAWADGCVYANGTHYLGERYHTGGSRDDLNFYLNFALSFAFPVIGLLFNIIFYSLPLPALVKLKFRE